MRIHFNGAVLIMAALTTLLIGCTSQPALRAAQRQPDDPPDGRVRLTSQNQVDSCIAGNQPDVDRVTLGADTLFEYRKSKIEDMLPGGRAELDQLAVKLGTSYTTILSVKILGYADRLGGANFNRRLSEERAQSVKSYLAGLGVGGELVAEGRGAADPVVNCGKTTVKTPELISCLQPNRRVVVEITGIR